MKVCDILLIKQITHIQLLYDVEPPPTYNVHSPTLRVSPLDSMYMDPHTFLYCVWLWLSHTLFWRELVQ